MYIMFIDEFGDSKKQSQNPAIQKDLDQPFIIITGVIVPIEGLSRLTQDLTKAKKNFFPNIVKGEAKKHPLSWLRTEVKGATLKKALRDNKSRLIKNHKRFLKKVFSLLGACESSLVSRILIKPYDKDISFENIYTSSVQHLAKEFNIFLEERKSKGMIILDSRDHHKDKQVCYSIVTKMHNRGRDQYPNIIEAPTFGHDNNHIGLQITDWITSGLLVPIVGYTYLNKELPENVHCHKNYKFLKDTFMPNLASLQFRYKRGKKSQGGIHVSNRLTKKGSYELFKSIP